jgi:uncharacterized membrane protein
MTGLINPLGWIEAAVTAGFEREVAKRLLGTSISAAVSFLWGLRTLPLFGRAFGAAATAIYLNITRYGLKEAVAVTVPSEIMKPDNTSGFVTIGFGQ